MSVTELPGVQPWAHMRNLPSSRKSHLVHVPAKVTFEQAAASLLQGMTAQYLTATTFPLKSGDTVLLHAGAGGVGLLLTQMAVAAGAHVISTVSTPEKAELARSAGAHDVILYTQEDFEPAVKRITGGRGVDVVYDSVGKETFERSLKCLRPRRHDGAIWRLERRCAAG